MMVSNEIIYESFNSENLFSLLNKTVISKEQSQALLIVKKEVFRGKQATFISCEVALEKFRRNF